MHNAGGSQPWRERSPFTCVTYGWSFADAPRTCGAETRGLSMSSSPAPVGPHSSTIPTSVPRTQVPDVTILDTFAEALPHLAWTADPLGWVHWYNRKWLSY